MYCFYCQPITFKVNNMDVTLSTDAIRTLGFEWPKTQLIQEYAIIENEAVNFDKTLDNLRKSRGFYRKQINAAYNFKQQTGADYSDFSDKFDDYVRMERLLNSAIRYLEQILAAHLKEISQ